MQLRNYVCSYNRRTTYNYINVTGPVNCKKLAHKMTVFPTLLNHSYVSYEIFIPRSGLVTDYIPENKILKFS